MNNDKLLFKLFVWKFFYPNLEMDEYMYTVLNKNPVFKRCLDAFPENEVTTEGGVFTYIKE